MNNTQKPKPSGAAWLTIFLSVSSALAILLALLGYGVALSIESRFGIPHATIFNSSSDLLTLGGWAVVASMARAGQLFDWAFYAGLLQAWWPFAKAALVTMAGIFALGSTALFFRWLARRWSWLRKQRTQTQALYSKYGRFARIAALPLIVLASVLVAVPLTMLGMLLGIVFLAFGLGIVPLVGVEAGTAHIDDWVISPSICVPLKSRDVRMERTIKKGNGDKVRAASCVAVKNADGEEHRGRVVFATFNAIVLYDPTAGSVRRVSTQGAVVKVIDTL
jgi:hypothetical protein